MSDAPKSNDPRVALELRERLADAHAGPGQLAGGDKALAVAEKKAAAAHDKLHESGRKSARERIQLLLDPGSFVELDRFVTHQCPDFDMPDKKVYGDGVVTGHGTVDGRPVVVFAQQAPVFGGSLGWAHAQKICKVMDLATTIGAPVIGLNDSGGARIQEGVASLAGYAEIFKRNVLTSGVVPQLSLILGPCAGGAVYSPALTDLVLMVEQSSYMFITGPDVIKTVTHEEVTKEALGGAATHNEKSGVAHFACPSEAAAMAMTRELLSYLPSNAQQAPPVVTCGDPLDRRDEALLDLVPANLRKPYDVRKVVGVLADAGRVLEIKPAHARNIVTAIARMDGRPVGFIANNPLFAAGMMDGNACDKAAHFIAVCDAFGLPLIYLIDVPGFAIGSGAERSRMPRRSAKMIHELGNATVPRVSIVLRKGYGLGYVAMCGGRGFGADACYAWPTAQICAMSVEGAVDIAYRKDIEAAPDPEARRAELIEGFKDRLGALRSTLRTHVGRSSLCAVPAFARTIEAIYLRLLQETGD